MNDSVHWSAGSLARHKSSVTMLRLCGSLESGLRSVLVCMESGPYRLPSAHRPRVWCCLTAFSSQTQCVVLSEGFSAWLVETSHEGWPWKMMPVPDSACSLSSLLS